MKDVREIRVHRSYCWHIPSAYFACCTQQDVRSPIWRCTCAFEFVRFAFICVLFLPKSVRYRNKRSLNLAAFLLKKKLFKNHININRHICVRSAVCICSKCCVYVGKTIVFFLVATWKEWVPMCSQVNEGRKEWRNLAYRPKSSHHRCF